jgi:hypothetical protein
MIKGATVPFPPTAPAHGAIVTYHQSGGYRICGSHKRAGVKPLLSVSFLLSISPEPKILKKSAVKKIWWKCIDNKTAAVTIL